MPNYSLSIGDLSQRTGVAQQTLRSWERRHGFPQPHHTDSGHRRYSQDQVELVHAVSEGRRRGLSLSIAIATALSVRGVGSHAVAPGTSLQAHLCSLHPDLRPSPIQKPMLIAISHAIEDEIIARAEPRVIFATFQRKRFFESARARWRELAVSSEAVIVFADFETQRRDRDHLTEIPIANDRPLSREWTIVYCGQRTSICMCARETAGSNPETDVAQRRFEVIWSVDPHIALEAAGFCLRTATAMVPELNNEVGDLLTVPPIGGAATQLGFLSMVVRRTLSIMSPEPTAIRATPEASSNLPST